MKSYENGRKHVVTMRYYARHEINELYYCNRDKYFIYKYYNSTDNMKYTNASSVQTHVLAHFDIDHILRYQKLSIHGSQL